MQEIRILWEDETAWVVAKPAGMLVHNSAWAGPREVSVVQRMGAAAYAVHRLDRGTSGVLVLARSPEHAAAWQRALVDENTVKVYLALVRGQLRAPVHVDHPLKDEDGVLHPAISDVRPVLTSVEPRCSVVAVRLHTGRTHQVRRHLHHLSHPVIGDANYGKGPLNRDMAARFGCTRLQLHALRLQVTHPTSGQRLNLVAPLPAELVTSWHRIFGDALLPAVDVQCGEAW
ncbi:MAG: pseudouridine synthase [Myxococcota bacterium]